MTSRRLAAAILIYGAVAATVPAQKPRKQVSDDAIYDAVRRKLANDPTVKGGALEIDVKDGVVTLRGKVDQDKQKVRAERLAHKVAGVTEVRNEIAVVARAAK